MPNPTGPSLSTARRYVVLAKHVPATVISVCVALVLGSGVVAALVLPAASDSTSVLRHPTAVTVAPAGGSAAPAHDGQILHPGDVVNVGSAGAGEITTGPRKLWLGAATQVRVDGPASTEIRRGSVVAEDPGRPWSLQADQVTVSNLNGSIRIDYSFTTRVADYAGRAQLNVPTGASATLTGLNQVEASGSILPGTLYPLKLDDDALDTVAAPALVALDKGLTALAGQIDADPIVLASDHSGSVDPSERLLPVAIAAAGTGGTDAARTQAALAARGNHGSWGVIAQRAGATLVGVRSALSQLLDSSPTQVAALAAAVAQTAPIATATPGAAAATKTKTAVVIPATSATPTPTSETPVTRPSASLPGVTLPAVPGVTPSLSVTVSATARPSIGSPSPSPAPTPLLNVLLNAVGGLLPSPKPTSSPTSGATPVAGTAATPAPAPTPLVNGLLNAVGGL